MNLKDLFGQLVKPGVCSFSFSGISFHGIIDENGNIQVNKIEVTKKAVHELLLNYIQTMGVDVSQMEFKNFLTELSIKNNATVECFEGFCYERKK